MPGQLQAGLRCQYWRHGQSIDYQEKSFPEITHQYLDSTKIARDTGWTASVSLADGLGYTVAQA